MRHVVILLFATGAWSLGLGRAWGQPDPAPDATHTAANGHAGTAPTANHPAPGEWDTLGTALNRLLSSSPGAETLLERFPNLNLFLLKDGHLGLPTGGTAGAAAAFAPAEVSGAPGPKGLSRADFATLSNALRAALSGNSSARAIVEKYPGYDLFKGTSRNAQASAAFVIHLDTGTVSPPSPPSFGPVAGVDEPTHPEIAVLDSALRKMLAGDPAIHGIFLKYPDLALLTYMGLASGSLPAHLAVPVPAGIVPPVPTGGLRASGPSGLGPKPGDE